MNTKNNDPSVAAEPVLHETETKHTGAETTSLSQQGQARSSPRPSHSTATTDAGDAHANRGIETGSSDGNTDLPTLPNEPSNEAVSVDDIQCQVYEHGRETKGARRSFRNIWSNILKGFSDVYRSNKSLKEFTRDLQERVRHLQSIGASRAAIKKAVADEKNQLPCATFSSLSFSRGCDAIESHTGLFCVDLDELNPGEIERLRAALTKDPHAVLIFLSPTATGLKVVFLVSGLPLWTGTQRLCQAEFALQANRFHRAAYDLLERYIKKHYGVQIDEKCKDSSRMCYLPHDPTAIAKTFGIPLLVSPPAADEDETSKAAYTDGHAGSSEAGGAKRATKNGQEESSKEAQTHGAPTPEGKQGDGKSAKQRLALSAEEVRRILSHVPADDYAVWLMVLGAVKLWGQQQDQEELAFELASQWAKSSSKYDAEAQRRTWDGLKRGEGENVVTMGSVIHLAMKNGWKWKNSRSADEKNGKAQNTNKEESGPPVSEYADRLEQLVGEVFCMGDEWYQLSHGTWRPVDREPIRKLALSVLDSNDEKNSLGMEVIRTVEGRKQCESAELHGFAIQEGSQSILLNCANGVLRVSPASVELLPHDCTRFFTRCLAAAYVPDSECPVFSRVLGEALPDEADQTLALLFSSYCLVPNCKLEVALFVYGPSGTAKSTIFEHGIGSALGVDLVERLSMGELCSPGSYSLPDLQHAALNLSSEGQAGEIPESAVFKKLVEGSPVQVRRIYGKPFEMANCHVKILSLSNHLPRWKNGTDAELRRTRFLAFEHRPAQADSTLKARVEGERDGIFSQLLVPGLRQLLGSYRMPMGSANSMAVRQRFALENDPIDNFISRYCTLGKDLWITNSELEHAFNAFLDFEDISSGLGSCFFRILRQRMPSLQKGRRSEHGIRVKGTLGIDLNASGRALATECSERID